MTNGKPRPAVITEQGVYAPYRPPGPEVLRAIREKIAYSPATGDMRWIGGQCAGEPAAIVRGNASGPFASVGVWSGDSAPVYLQAHRVAWYLSTGEWPAFLLRCLDGNRLNLRIANFAPARSYGHRKKNIAVCVSTRKLKSFAVTVRKKHLGTYPTLAMAIDVRDACLRGDPLPHQDSRVASIIPAKPAPRPKKGSLPPCTIASTPMTDPPSSRPRLP